VVLDAVEKLDTSGTVLRASLIVARSAVSVLAEGGPGRAMVARSVFERLEASGFRELKVHLTEEARAHAFAAAIPAQFTACVGYGRGERI
jgi:hypothetical protein